MLNKIRVSLHNHRREHYPRRNVLCCQIAAMALAACLFFATAASASTPEFLWRAPEGDGAPTGAAGGLYNPRGIVADPSSGHVYVSDLQNARIDEFTSWGAFIKAWGWDVSPDGAPGDTVGDQLEVCTTICQTGTRGNGAGQIGAPHGIALDSSGDVYLLESTLEASNRRVQKFDSEGHFLLMFGGEVDKTTKADVCTSADLEAGDECGAGVPGAGPGQFSNGSVGNYIAYSRASEAILVGDVGRIEILNLDGSFRDQIVFSGPLSAFAGKNVRSLAVDATGNIYFTLEGIEDAYKVSPTGEPLAPGKPGETTYEAETPLALAVDGQESLYVIDDPPGELSADQARVLAFNAEGKRVIPDTGEAQAERRFPELPLNGPSINGIATNLCAGSEAPGNLYLTYLDGLHESKSFVEAYGSPPTGCEAPPSRPPDIAAQYATSVGTTEGTLKAQINPRFWSDTTYKVEYGTGKCSEGACTKQTPEVLLSSKSVNKVLRTAGVFLSGLEFGTTYHYRFIAQSGGGGPVRGVGGGVGSDGTEGTFTTFPATASPATGCSNQTYRSGAAASLPDCRAYEMVSPIDKEGGDVGLPPTRFSAEINQAAVSGERFTFSSMTAFAGAESSPFVSQYLASRNPAAGWSTGSVSPPRSAGALDTTYAVNLNDYKGFSADLCSGWVRHNSVSTLSEEAIPGYANLYRRDNCASQPTYEALSTVKAPKRPPREYLLSVLGFSADATRTILVADDKLTSDAPALDPTKQGLTLYIKGAEGLRFICHLPDGKAITTACGPGLPAAEPLGESSNLENAISTDGSRVYWTAYGGPLPGGTPVAGALYLRLNADQAQSKVSGGQCAEEEKACTLPVSATVSSDPARFLGASEDGSKALFDIKAGPLAGNLYEYDLQSRSSQLLAEGSEAVMGMSGAGSRVYFASRKVLAPGATEGAHNLYLYEGGGSYHFIMTTPEVVGSENGPTPVEALPKLRSSAVSFNGDHVAFVSEASPTPTGYDNTDVAEDEPDLEVYLYDAAQEKLHCVSCNPTGARPTGLRIGSKGAGSGHIPYLFSARLPHQNSTLHAPRSLSADGSRLFFESYEALVPRDTNGTWDVYQWEAPGSGDCSELTATYGAVSEGCVDLISSGKSPAPSRFLDADPSGDNVFISTLASLVPSDPGLNDVYDARVGGGFAEAQKVTACEGEACQGPSAPPLDPTPASSSFEGAGNLSSAAVPKPRCRKAEVRRKGRCVTGRHKPRKRRGQQHKRHAKQAGAGR